MTKNIIATGNGTLAQSIRYEFEDRDDINLLFTTSRNTIIKGNNVVRMDLQSINKFTDWRLDRIMHDYDVKIDAIVHTAAFTDVDKCASTKHYANYINSIATRRLARYCNERAIDFYFISTDFVYDGKNNNEYNARSLAQFEDSETYAYTKRDAEISLMALSDIRIIRTSFLYSIDDRVTAKDFVRFIKYMARSGHVGLVSDMNTRLTDAANLAKFLAYLINNETRNRIIYNFGGNMKGSPYIIGKKIIDILGYDTEIEKLKQEDIFNAKRPENSCMDISMVKDMYDDGTIFECKII